MSSHVSGGWRAGDHPGGGHGMSSHVSGGGEWEITQGGTWDELPCEWGGGDKGGA